MNVDWSIFSVLDARSRFDFSKVFYIIFFCKSCFKYFHCSYKIWCQEEVIDIYNSNDDFTFQATNKNAGITIQLLKANMFVEWYDILIPQLFGLL